MKPAIRGNTGKSCPAKSIKKTITEENLTVFCKTITEENLTVVLSSGTC